MILRKSSLGWAVCALIPVCLFWLVLVVRIPTWASRYIALYTALLFLLVGAMYYLSFRQRGAVAVLAGLGLTMLLFSLCVSYKWTSGYSDTGMLGGLLPYKDAKDYYAGASRILSGLPLEHGVHSMRRPLFAGLLASVLLFTGRDLKLSLAVLALLAGIGLYVSARQIRDSCGSLAGAAYSALMFFYIQPLLGYSMSELAGFTLGCFAFSVLWVSSDRRYWPGIVFGLITLMAAVSSRSGAFLIFPPLILWTARSFRGTGQFSWRAAGITAGVTALSYYLMNAVIPNLLAIPPGHGFGSFAYALYGQVHGGTGWHSAIDDLHTTQLKVIAVATIRFFLAHPLSFVIAAAKSYRELFLPGPQTIFAYNSSQEPVWLNDALWAGTLALMIWGLVKSLKKPRFHYSGLVLASFAGIILSIPFLPPVDAGARFYASTMAFLFAPVAVALDRVGRGDHVRRNANNNELALVASGALILLVLAGIAPALISHLTVPLAPSPPVCVSEQHPFVIQVTRESYIDLIPDGTGRCGVVPEVCLSDFDRHGTEKSSDDFFQDLLSMARSSGTGIRITPGINLVDTRFHYFVDRVAPKAVVSRTQTLAGCAIEVLTKNQSIYQVVSSRVIAP